MNFPFGYFGVPGPFELIVVAVIVLLLFGKRLPSVMGSLGRSIVEFKKGVSGIEDEIDQAGKEIEDAPSKDEEINGNIERDPAKR